MKLTDGYADLLAQRLGRRRGIDIAEALLFFENVAVETSNQSLELGQQIVRYVVLGFDRQVLFLKSAIRGMLYIGSRLSRQHVLDDVGHVRHHLDQHDHFVEMVQVIGRQQRGCIDIGPLQAFRPHGHIR